MTDKDPEELIESVRVAVLRAEELRAKRDVRLAVMRLEGAERWSCSTCGNDLWIDYHGWRCLECRTPWPYKPPYPDAYAVDSGITTTVRLDTAVWPEDLVSSARGFAYRFAKR